MLTEVQTWWELALDDLDTAQKNFEIGKYHLKKTHDLFFLASKLNLPETYKSICKRLNPVYLQTRYPDVSGLLPPSLFTKKDATEFIAMATDILEWVKKKLSSKN